MKIALIGLGKMGSALARRLLLANLDVTVFNRTKEKMQPLVHGGAKGAETLKAAVEGADIIITSLLDDNAVLQTVNGNEGFINFLMPGAIHVGTSTILPDTSKKLDALHQKNNSIYIAANVLGVPKVADKGELTSFVAGDDDAIKKCEPIFQSYSSKIIRVSKHPYQANVVKICMNYFLVSAIEIMGELYTFSEKNEVDGELINSLFHSIFAHPAFNLYVDKIQERNFNDVNFDLKGGLKDINLFEQAFTNALVVPDIASVIKSKFIIAMAHHMQEKDWSAVTDITRKQANLDTD